MRNRTATYFEGKISQVLSRNPEIQDIHEVAILALRNQQHSLENEFYLDCALAILRIEKTLETKKVMQEYKTTKLFPLAA